MSTPGSLYTNLSIAFYSTHALVIIPSQTLASDAMIVHEIVHASSAAAAKWRQCANEAPLINPAQPRTLPGLAHCHWTLWQPPHGRTVVTSSDV